MLGLKLTCFYKQVEIVEGCRLPVLRKNQEHEDEWRKCCPFVFSVRSYMLNANLSWLLLSETLRPPIKAKQHTHEHVVLQ